MRDFKYQTIGGASTSKFARFMAKADGFEIMQGHIEMDETLVGGYRAGKRRRAAEGKTIVFGMLERETGQVSLLKSPNSNKSLEFHHDTVTLMHWLGTDSTHMAFVYLERPATELNQT